MNICSKCNNKNQSLPQEPVDPGRGPPAVVLRGPRDLQGPAELAGPALVLPGLQGGATARRALLPRAPARPAQPGLLLPGHEALQDGGGQVLQAQGHQGVHLLLRSHLLLGQAQQVDHLNSRI